MATSDPVQDYLERRGCSRQLIEGGLDGLVTRWERIVDEVVRGYGLSIDDYLNDMDLRDIVDGALGAATEKQSAALRGRMAAADEQFLAATVVTRSLWGEIDADDPLDEEALDPERSWWYFRRPRFPGPSLAEDLEAAGL